MLMEDGKLECICLEAANPAAEVVHVEEGRENRLPLHPVPVGDSTRIGFDIADDRRWEHRVVEGWPLRKRAKVLNLIFGFLCSFDRGWTDASR